MEVLVGIWLLLIVFALGIIALVAIVVFGLASTVKSVSSIPGRLRHKGGA